VTETNVIEIEIKFYHDATGEDAIHTSGHNYETLHFAIRDLSTFTHYTALHCTTPIDPNSNHAQELHHLQSRSIACSPAPVLRCMPIRHVLFQGLSEGRLEKAAQENLQVSQRGEWSHAGSD
jgi:hypothetical protein